MIVIGCKARHEQNTHDATVEERTFVPEELDEVTVGPTENGTLVPKTLLTLLDMEEISTMHARCSKHLLDLNGNNRVTVTAHEISLNVVAALQTVLRSLEGWKSKCELSGGRLYVVRDGDRIEKDGWVLKLKSDGSSVPGIFCPGKRDGTP
jgi:hypothetical protein